MAALAGPLLLSGRGQG